MPNEAGPNSKSNGHIPSAMGSPTSKFAKDVISGTTSNIANKIVIPAIIAENQIELDQRIHKVKNYVNIIQLDFMDGIFVPNHSIDFDFKIP